MKIDLRKKVKRENDPECLWSIFPYRKISFRIALNLARTRVTPNQVTFWAFLCLLIAAILLASGIYPYFIIAATLIQVYLILDLTDGDLARLKNMQSKYGKWLDGVVDNVGTSLILFGLSFGLYAQTQNALSLILGFFALFGFFILKYSYYYGLLTFAKEKIVDTMAKLSFVRLIYSALINFSVVLQMLLFTIGAITNQLLPTLLIFAFWSNFLWIVKFFRNYRIREGLK